MGTTRVIGVVFDDGGYGDDGASWGGEFLVADYRGYERATHLAYVPLPGAEAAARNPCRMALSHLRSAGVPWDPSLPSVGACDDNELNLLDRQLETGLRCVADVEHGTPVRRGRVARRHLPSSRVPRPGR